MKQTRLSYKDIPNIISLIRVLLVLPFVCSIHSSYVFEHNKNWLLTILFLAIIISDIFDGYLARLFNCTSNIGAKLDIISDTIYTISFLIIFVYFKIIPAWFIFIMVLKLLEFIITSKIINNIKRTKNMAFFDKTGKLSVLIVMLLPGIFIFRYIITDYKIIMNYIIYVITFMLIISSVNRILKIIKYIGIWRLCNDYEFK